MHGALPSRASHMCTLSSLEITFKRRRGCSARDPNAPHSEQIIRRKSCVLMFVDITAELIVSSSERQCLGSNNVKWPAHMRPKGMRPIVTHLSFGKHRRNGTTLLTVMEQTSIMASPSDLATILPSTVLLGLHRQRMLTSVTLENLRPVGTSISEGEKTLSTSMFSGKLQRKTRHVRRLDRTSA